MFDADDLAEIRSGKERWEAETLEPVLDRLGERAAEFEHDTGGQSGDRLYTPATGGEGDRGEVLVRLTPPAVHELELETEGLAEGGGRHGTSTGCDMCGAHVAQERAVANAPGAPCKER